jgi:hypothetical protein
MKTGGFLDEIHGPTTLHASWFNEFARAERRAGGSETESEEEITT